MNPESKILRLDFVNHKYVGRMEVESVDRKPRSIIVDHTII